MLSIILPSIRPHNLDKLYHSIICDCFELIIISPYDLPDCLKQYKNIKYVRDFGSPVRASQIGATLAEGKYITWMADDGVYINSLDNIIKMLNNDDNTKNVVCCKYTEGDGIVHNDNYYLLQNAYPYVSCVKSNWWIFNLGIMHTSYFNSLGGWDCSFETTALSHADLALRAQLDNASVNMLQTVLIECTHMPNITGDHAPVHYAHTEHDANFYSIKNQHPQIKIDINNWKNSPKIWSRRFV